MADVPRRLRTQAERDTDGTTWRAPECLTSHPQLHADCDGCTCPYHRTPKPPPDKTWLLAEYAAPPRRRWWHRYTRRNP